MAARPRLRRVLGCFGLTEPDIGSDAGNLTRRPAATATTGCSTARRSSSPTAPGPTSRWSSRAPAARARAASRRSSSRPTADGFEAREVKGKLGLRGQATAALLFDRRARARRRLLGEEGQGFQIAMTALDKGRVAIAAGCVGIVQGCLETAVEYATARAQFGRPIASYQLVQDMIADISVDADAARLLVWRAADLIERGEPFGAAASKAKLFASEAAVRAANHAIQVFGGYGYVDEYPAEKYLRDARVMTLYEGTSQIQKLIIGRAETGISAFL